MSKPGRPTRSLVQYCAGNEQDTCWHPTCIRCDGFRALRSVIQDSPACRAFYNLGFDTSPKHAKRPYSDLEVTQDSSYAKRRANEAYMAGWLMAFRHQPVSLPWRRSTCKCR
jgi:hypothetical protein